MLFSPDSGNEFPNIYRVQPFINNIISYSKLSILSHKHTHTKDLKDKKGLGVFYPGLFPDWLKILWTFPWLKKQKFPVSVETRSIIKTYVLSVWNIYMHIKHLYCQKSVIYKNV